MRTREQITANITRLVNGKENYETISAETQLRLLEVLLDIRDLLSQQKPTVSAKEETV